MVDSYDLEVAERTLAQPTLSGVSKKEAQFSRAWVDRAPYERYLEHSRDNLRSFIAIKGEGEEQMPALTPAQEAAVLGYMTQMFLVGVLAGRADQKRIS